MSSPISGGYPDVIPTAFLLGALRLADRHTARLISEGIIDRNSAEAVIGEVEAALMAIHPGLFSTVFPEVTTRSIPPGN